jgi:hypothetical protein
MGSTFIEAIDLVVEVGLVKELGRPVPQLG